jgi:hypothetical protein
MKRNKMSLQPPGHAWHKLRQLPAPGRRWWWWWCCCCCRRLCTPNFSVACMSRNAHTTWRAPTLPALTPPDLTTPRTHTQRSCARAAARRRQQTSQHSTAQHNTGAACHSGQPRDAAATPLHRLVAGDRLDHTARCPCSGPAQRCPAAAHACALREAQQCGSVSRWLLMRPLLAAAGRCWPPPPPPPPP